MMRFIRQRFSLKMFISYALVILVNVVILAVTANLAIPRFFSSHMRSMGAGMGDMMGNMLNNSGLRGQYEDFRIIFFEALIFGILVAFIFAILVSAIFSQRVVAPVKEMMVASHRIAEGRFNERVRIPGDGNPERLDELGQLAVSFNQMAEKLEKTESMRRQLIGDVSHELRTPLSAIKGSMEALEDGVLPPKAETFQQIQREAVRMERLVDDLQELSRVEAGAFDLNMQRQSIQGLVGEVVKHFEPAMKAKGIEVSLNLPQSLPDLLMDEDRIWQVLSNLLGNALQYTPAGGRVEVSAQKQGNEIIFCVRDSGIGIPKEHLKHIFTRFYRVDKSRSRAFGGSGIGLTIAQHLVQAHGGRIWAESEGEGKGSAFYFSLLVG